VLQAAACAACGRAPRDTTIAYAWQAAGTTVSLAAWAEDSARLRATIERLRDSMQRIDAARLRDAVRRAWAAERATPRLQPDWRDVSDSYALDAVAPALAGVADSALFDLGGQFLWLGPVTRRPVGIADPDNSLRIIAQVEFHAGSLSTVTGEHRSITVLAPTAFKASAWASALFSLGCDRALALATDRSVSLVCADSAGVRWSPGLQNRVVLPSARVP
jgi:thiamine biosynthesis lipoprotein ApbE